VDINLLIMFIVAIILFLAINVKEKSKIFGIIADLLMMTTAGLLFLEDLRLDVGMSRVETTIGATKFINETPTVVYAKDIYNPNPIFIMAIFFLLISIYVIYSNALLAVGAK
jgi:hypothetical protein